MALRKVRPRKAASITSLIDVIFLLLLFFMLASTFSHFSELEIVAADGGRSTSSPDDRGLSLLVSADRLNLDGQFIEEADLAVAIERRMAGLGGQVMLSVSVDEGATTQRLVDILSSLPRKSSLDVKVMEPA
ncbi:ExbD/TolR family protein [Henriciella algicola]|uniref:Biopolymer transporter ExbD n=1 Tax=Henriciella algicola TaxID=1608422 RepID=A0A399RI27_9PROT|nr:biopolymer transporter ExbD [Henriciella algicola]RIJ31320.1 biopolymer transporter ExbD [Henriciella algicola]